MSVIKTFASVLTLSLLLAACSLVPQRPDNQTLTWSARQQQLSAIKAWKIQGALALATSKESFSATYVWQQQSQQTYTIDLFGPLNLGAIKLVGLPKHVTLTLSNKQTLTGPSAQSLLAQALGWHLPVDPLYYWLRGLPAPGSQAQRRFDPYHHLNSLSQQNCHIEYLSYMSVNGVDLPHKIRLSTPFLRALIVINRWGILKES